MYFQNRSPTSNRIIWSIIFYGIGLIAAWGVSMGFLVLGNGELIILPFIVVFVALSLLCFYVAWTGLLELKIELSASPREARCYRKNVLTRLSSERRYRIKDNARVVFGDEVGGGLWSPTYWPIRITGIPRYYDFYDLGRCHTYDRAFALSRKLAMFLGIGLYDRKGDAYPMRDTALPDEERTGPEKDGSHRSRRRRRK